MVADEILRVLMQYHREVVLPDMQRLEERLESRMSDRMNTLHRETLGHIDEIYKRFDRLESEYFALTAALKQLEERVSVLEEQVFGCARETTIEELDQRIEQLRDRTAALETHVGVSGPLAGRSALEELETRVSALERKFTQ